MPLVMTQIEEAPRDTRMTLVHDEFLNEYGGRLRAGTVVLVDQATARKWRVKGIAVDSAITDKTLREQKQLELQRIKDELEALNRPPDLAGPLYRALAPAEREQIAARLGPSVPRAPGRKPAVRGRKPKAAPSSALDANVGDGQD